MIQDLIRDRLIAVGNPNVTAAIESNLIKLVRHTPISGYTFNDILYNNDVLEYITSEQSREVFARTSYVFCFLAEDGSTCSFLKGYKVDGLLNASEIDIKFPYRKSRNRNMIYYKLSPLEDFDDYWNRLVIDWGKSSISWHQRKLDKQIFCLRPRGYIKSMPRWNRIRLEFQELKALTQNNLANSEWENYLSNHDGIYLIRDKKSNKMYIGSAYGKEGGIWGRWMGYAKTGHNGNKGIVKFIAENNASINYFEFSLLEIFPKGVTSKVVIDAENHYKERYGTRIFGLNEN